MTHSQPKPRTLGQTLSAHSPASLCVLLTLFSLAGCTSGGPCDVHADCRYFEQCLVDTCVPLACESDEHCEEGTFCSDSECVECVADEECGDGVCASGVCNECREDADCGEGLLCDQTFCVTSGSVDCIADEDCPSAAVCRDHLCLPACASSDECDGSCDAGACAACVVDADCGDGRCVGETCRNQCETSADCRPEQACRAQVCTVSCDDEGEVCRQLANELILDFANNIEPPFPLPLPRLADSGCQISGEALVGGSLCDGEAPYQAQRVCDPCLASLGGCRGECVGGDCVCEDTADCPSGRVCDEGVCAPCQTNEQCGCGEYCSHGNCHEGCVDDSSCLEGTQCIEGRCSECGGAVTCPEGLSCYEDGCVEPCTEGDHCSPSGRLSICTTFAPFEESLPLACEG